MIISESMGIGELAERMGFGNFDEIDWNAVETMQSLLAEEFDGQDTATLDERDWLKLIDRSQQM